MNRERWCELMASMSADDNLDTFDSLVAAYSEKQRHYHTADHIDHCLDLFDRHRHLAERPVEVELALWFHDAIYNPLSKDNEARSAQWATKFLTAINQDESLIKRVNDMILATIHDAALTDGDTQLLVDIDLSILGSAPDIYNEFEKNVRREYKWVPSPLFRRERRKILKSFADRHSIYSTTALREQLEAPARENLARAIASLT
jgi:predicted metal-dependent HD superfamily phosphohydrolase